MCVFDYIIISELLLLVLMDWWCCSLYSYVVSVGIVDKLTQYFRKVQGPIDDDKDGAEFLQHSLGLLVAMTKIMSKR